MLKWSGFCALHMLLLKTSTADNLLCFQRIEFESWQPRVPGSPQSCMSSIRNQESKNLTLMYKSIFNTFSLLKTPKPPTKKATKTTATMNVRLLLIFLSKCPSWNFRASAFFSAYFKNKVSKANFMNWLTTVIEMTKILLT